MQVQGRVYVADGRTADGVVLSFHRMGFGGTRTTLGTAITQLGGSYSFAFETRGAPVRIEITATAAAEAGAVRGGAIAVLGGRAAEISLIETMLESDQADVKVLNLVVPVEVQPLAAEYTRLTTDVGRHLDGGRLADAQERTGRRDITLLAQTTGWDGRLIALAANAESLAERAGVEPDVAYALLRVGLPTQQTRLAMVSPKGIGLALAKAVESGVVTLTPTQVEAAQAAFERFATVARRDLVAPGALSSHGELLTASGLPAAEQDRLDHILTAHTGDDEQLWAAVAEAGLPVERIQLTARLGHLTGNNVPLIDDLSRTVDHPDRLREVLVGQQLYQSRQWVERLRTLAQEHGRPVEDLIPSMFDAPTAEQRLEAYSTHLAGLVRASYPTNVVADMVRTDQLVLGPGHDNAKTDVAMALDRAAAPATRFELGSAPLNTFLREHGDAMFAGMAPEQVATATGHIKKLQRLYQITPTDEAMKVLLDNGFGGARDVTAIPYEKYMKRYGGKFPNFEQANRTYAKAQEGEAIAYAFFGAAKQIAVAPPVHALSPAPTVVEEAQNNLIRHYPTMEKLFGSLDFCECDHCASVLSPAAYLVDILKFVDPDDTAWSQEVNDWPGDHDGAAYPYPNKKEWEADGKPSPIPPFKALTERRPDLPVLPLTCENTHTAMPYIDIVNEVLEFYVVNGKLTKEAVHDTGAASTPDLLAEPQNLLPAAYDRLKDAVYPLRLPFDLWLETVRRFSEYFNAPLWRLLEALAPTDLLYPPPGVEYGAAAVALERLGLTPAERAVLTRPDALSDWQELYGYDPAKVSAPTALAALSNARTLAQRLGVTYRDLVALVRTGFVNPKLETLVSLRKLGVDTEDVLRYVEQPGSPPFTDDEKAAFEEKLGPQSLAWVKQGWTAGDFGRILVLASPDVDCGFDNTTLRYADGTPASAMVLVLLNLFVRLRRRLDWSIEELDRALGVFLPGTPDPRTATTIGPAMASALLGIARLDALTGMLKAGRKGRLALLPLWSPLDDRRYVELFLTGRTPEPVFEQPLGHYLSHLSGGVYQPFHYDGTAEDVSTGNVGLAKHLGSVQAALQLTSDEVAAVLTDAGITPETAPLNLDTISVLYRYGLLARMLRMSVGDIIFLKAVSGLEPFQAVPDTPVVSLDQDHPQATVNFVLAAAAIKESGLSVADLDYLIRHRFDVVGPHRAASTAPLGLARGLAVAIARIRADHPDPADPLLFTDEVIRQKLALVLTPDVVDTFTAMWAATIEYDTVRGGVLETDKLDPDDFAAVPAISVGYDPVRQEQHLRYRGVLTAPVRTAVNAALPGTLPAWVGELLDAAQQQAADFFTRQLLKAVVTGVGEVGFLAPADLDLLFVPAPASQDADKARRARLADAFLPYLRQRLIRAVVAQTVAADLGAEPPLAEALLTEPALIDDPDVAGRDLLAAYAAIGEPGLTTSTVDDGIRLDGYLEVPVSGGYRFSIRCDSAGTDVQMRFDHLADPLLRQKTTDDNLEPSAHCELKAGVLYGFTLEASTAAGTFTPLVRGEQLPKGPLDRLATYPRATVNKLHRAHLLLAKTIRLTGELGLSERELRYLLTHPADFDSLDLGELPTQAADDTPSGARELFRQFRRLVGYTGLRRSLGAEPDDLVAILERARRTFPPDAVPSAAAAEVLSDVCGRLAAITRRKLSNVEEAAAVLGFAAKATSTTDGVEVVAEGFLDERAIGRIWQVLALAARLGVPPNALQRWATPRPDDQVARDMRDTVRARFSPEQWRRVAQPIFDALRQRRRDALVAYVGHTGGFASLEEMFEYFLIDPGTEPVVQTSRLRLAISSVQLFIQRCLLGLELKVHPSALNPGHWQWMKRYRVWEANRKIFLWPENWLEPEFRDDKTNLFGDLEGALLQSDISNDSAEAAFIAYLRGLEQLARLDIRAIHLEERDDPSSNTLHVLARTYSTPYAYFYRSYAQQMWTPWVPVTGELSDHATIAVWRGRVHVLWVNFLTKSESQKPPASDKTKAAEVPMSKLAAMTPKMRVQGRLSWMVYFQGAWSTPAATEFLSMADFAMTYFDPADVGIYSATDSGGALRVSLYGAVSRSFKMTSIHAAPTLDGSSYPDSPYSGVQHIADSYNPITKQITPMYGGAGLAVNHFGELEMKGSKVTSVEPAHTVILGNNGGGDYELVTNSQPLRHFPDEVGTLVAPFFYVDEQHTLFVEPKVTDTPIEKGNGYLGLKPFVVDGLDMKQKWAEVRVLPQKPIGPGPVEEFSPDAKFRLHQEPDWLTETVTHVELGGTPIDAGGGTVFDTLKGMS